MCYTVDGGEEQVYTGDLGHHEEEQRYLKSIGPCLVSKGRVPTLQCIPAALATLDRLHTMDNTI
jgi:hypothetical protein